MSVDLKKLTVRALKDLARKQVGKGFSRLKTKADLIAALTKAAVPVPVPVPKRAEVTHFPKAAPEPRRAEPVGSPGTELEFAL